MKFRVIRNKSGKYQPQEKWLFLWCNFYDGYTDYLVEFNTFEEADKYVKDRISFRKSNNLQTLIVKIYNYEEE